MSSIRNINKALALSFVFLLSVFPSQSGDIFLYLSLGKRFLSGGSFPQTDPYLFSIPEYRWNILHEWGSFVLSSVLYSLGGWRALILAKAALLVATASLIFLQARKLKYESPLLPLVIVLSFFAGSIRFTERSSLFSDCFTVLLLVTVISLRKDRYAARWPGFFLPVLFLVWANLHPGFFLGLLILSLALAVDFPRYARGEKDFLRFAKACAMSVVACLCNPRGLDGFLFPMRPFVEKSWDVFRKNNFEWMPTLSGIYVRHLSIRAFLFLLAVCCGLALVSLVKAARKKRWDELPLFELAILFISLYLGLGSVRFVSTAAFLAGALTIYFLSRGSAVSAPFLAVGVTALLAAINLQVIRSGYPSPLGPRKWGFGVDEYRRPAGVSELIEKMSLEGNIFNERGFGCYLAWRWEGRRKIFIHGFVDDFDFSEKDYYSVQRSGSGLERIVKKYDFGAFLLAAPDPARPMPPLYKALSGELEWRLVYKDRVAVLFVRDTPENSKIIRATN